MAQGYVRSSDLPQVIPVFPLPGATMLPRGQLPLNIFEPRYLNMVDDAMAGDRMIGMIQTVGPTGERPPLMRVGCAGRITSFAETSDGRYLITLTGIARFRIATELQVKTPYRQVRADFSPYAHDLDGPDPFESFDRDSFLGVLAPYLGSRGLDIDWDTARAAPAEALINSLSMGLPFEPAEKQALVEASSLRDRCEALTALLHIDSAGTASDEDIPPRVQ
ncbi:MULTISPECIES: LON peptidase substrate-binding domain-containing protein [unclassified Brevundimonas]|uniref:LON peptidase substrate-binding domain-containing protein n=1 Tax=unclassified Brevundimonas TaxID=2622653 RepID=UPI0025BC8DB3|nr:MULTISPECIES: LON peptidase substrate-binding domain-containing protein [unclassified Brevundimonas]